MTALVMPFAPLAPTGSASANPSISDADTALIEVVSVRRGRRRMVLRGMRLASDAIAVAFAMLAAGGVEAILGVDVVAGAHTLGLAAIAFPVTLVSFAHYRLYDVRRVAGRLEEFRRTVQAVVVSALVVSAVAFFGDVLIRRGVVLLAAGIGVPILVIEREIFRRILQRLHERGRLLRKVVVIGDNEEAEALAAYLAQNLWHGLAVVGTIPVRPADGKSGAAALNRFVEHAVRSARRTGAAGVLVATTSVDTDTTNRLARRLTEAGLEVELTSALCDIDAHRLTVSPLGRYPMVHIAPVRRRGWRAGAKRLLDLAVALTLLLVVAPFLAVISVMIRRDSEGRVLFRQQRVGRDGVPFDVLKFRTMVVNAEELLVDLRDQNEADGPLFKLKNDPRITRIGAVLRKLSLDEVPQLWNVVRGEMSLVGPRPALPSEVESWDESVHDRLHAKPGITGMWQVNGRSNAAFDDYVRLDLYYVDNWSLLTDLAILAKTLPVVLLRKGAY